MFGFDILDKAGEKTVERIFLSLLEEFKAEDIDTAVKEDISLLDNTANFRPKTLALAERLAKQFNGQQKHLTFDNVMLWLSEKREDFYFRIRFNMEAQKWLERQIKEIKEFLWF
jgi:hypothetical protein